MLPALFSEPDVADVHIAGRELRAAHLFGDLQTGGDKSVGGGERGQGAAPTGRQRTPGAWAVEKSAFQVDYDCRPRRGAVSQDSAPPHLASRCPAFIWHLAAS